MKYNGTITEIDHDNHKKEKKKKTKTICSYNN